MKAYVLKEAGGIQNLQLTELPIPNPRRDEVLIKVKAISINPVDFKTRAGFALYDSLKDIDPLILGWDISGKVISAGSEVTTFKIGDEVFGMINFPGHGAGYAEYVVAPADHLALKPAGITHAEAAAATLAALTAWQALTVHTKAKSGSQVLIHAASGGVGHYAVQIASHLGAEVTGTSSGANRKLIKELGATFHIDYQQQQFEKLSTKYDIILDALGGDHFLRSLEAVKKNGTVINLIPDPQAAHETYPDSQSTLGIAAEKGINAVYFPVTSSGKDMEAIARLLENGILRSHISKTFDFEELPQAHAYMEPGRTVGKVVVLLNG
ncbi:NADP-dependent oxidoreductase [Pedobacter antarcticus]|uniref:NADP-dependent oxidoreductase n=1 Tax=Pedobacter antarcticus TaxID=34086 RepID=UPI001C58F8D6|nr:NADP-dependent oxidoreductase [Pedobacter antarcticus]